MDKIQVRYMKLNIEHELLKSKHKREMNEIYDHAVFALEALEREIIWIKLQEGNGGVPSHLIEVQKRLKAMHQIGRNGKDIKAFKMEPYIINNGR